METNDKFMLTIKEAAPYFSIGQKKTEKNGGKFDYPEESLDEPEGRDE